MISLKLLFDDFLMTTYIQEIKSLRKKEQKILRSKVMGYLM